MPFTVHETLLKEDAMKKTALGLALALCFMVSPLHAEDLKVGMTASDWSFEDADKNMFTMKSWEGKVLMVTYVDPDEADMNEHLTEAMKKAKDEGILRDEDYQGIGIADCAATWKPNFAIRMIADAKAKKYKTTILFDYDATLRKAWGLKKDASNCILLDKKRVVHYISRGRAPDEEVEPAVKLAAELQEK